ncbi:MAG: TonB-dependent receptor [Deltaproteobacteria bacterium]|nr:TonB-dependent receptor [Deltaproteobacteria bacterium]
MRKLRLRCRDVGLVLALPLLLLSAMVHAQGAPPEEAAAAAVLVPPRLVDFVQAAYPSAAEEQGLEATVVLELTIAADGVVTNARVSTAAGHGFDEAALEAARRFRFEPATRDGTPIPVIIGYRYHFELQHAEPPEEPTTPTPGRIVGRVIGLEDGLPLLEAEVVLTQADGDGSQRQVTGSDGRFRFDGLAPGAYALRVITSEYGELDQAEEVHAGEATDVVYRMRLTSGPGDELEFGATAVIDPPPREVTRRTIRREEMTRIPGTRGDPLRAVELLPGVARPPFGAGALIVRGSSPNDSEVFFAGSPVPLLYHFGGLTSFVPGSLLQRIDFFPGNFSVRYGRKIGGILEVTPRDPATDDVHGAIDLNVIDLSAMVEAPVGDNFSFALAGRRSVVDAVFNAVIPDDALNSLAAPVYWDYQALATWRPTNRDKIRLLVYASSDRFRFFVKEVGGNDPLLRGNLELSTRFFHNQISWTRQLSANVEQELQWLSGTTRINFGLGEAIGVDARFVQNYGRAEWRARLSDRVRVIGGLDVLVVPFDIRYTGPAVRQQEGRADHEPLSSQQISDNRFQGTAFQPGFYLESDLQVTSNFEAILGLRLDYFQEIDAFVFDPRLVARYEIREGTVLKAGAGMFGQPPEFQESNSQVGNPRLDPIRAAHFDVGVDQELGEGIRFGVEGFYKQLWRRVVGVPGGLDPVFTNEGVGRIYGLEVSGRIEPIGRRFFGYLSYTLSRSERRDGPGERWRLFDFDQTHIFTLSGVYRFNRGWELGGTLRLVSGNPNTPISGSIYDATSGVYLPINGRINSTRNPLFNRLDVRISKEWAFQSWKLSLYLDVQNVYNRANREGINYNFDYSESAPIRGFPILPALGIRGEM